MTNDLAAAVAADSEPIITSTSTTSPPEACDPLGVEAIHPDNLLLDLHDLNAEAVRTALEQQAADLPSTLATRRTPPSISPPPAYPDSSTRSAAPEVAP